MDKYVLDWMKSYPWLIEFEQKGSLPDSITERWEFYYKAQRALLELPHHISEKARISSKAELVNNVFVHDSAQILPGAFIAGPAYIGENALVGNSALIRPGTFMSNNSIIGNHSYCTQAILGPGAGAFHFVGISRSLLGENSRLSAFVVTATTRSDLKPIRLTKTTRNLGEGVNKRGCIIGENTFLSPHVLVGSGISIGSNCFIGSFCRVFDDVDDNTKISAVIKQKKERNSVFTEKTPKYPDITFSISAEDHMD